MLAFRWPLASSTTTSTRRFCTNATTTTRPSATECWTSAAGRTTRRRRVTAWDATPTPFTSNSGPSRTCYRTCPSVGWISYYVIVICDSLATSMPWLSVVMSSLELLCRDGRAEGGNDLLGRRFLGCFKCPDRLGCHWCHCLVLHDK